MTRLSETQKELVKAISQECNTPAEVTSLLKSLFAGTLEQMLQADPRHKCFAFIGRAPS